MRRSRPKQPTDSGHVTVTHGGKDYTASWSLSDGIITVQHELGSRKTQFTEIPGNSAESFARLLLSEIVPH